MKTVKSSTLELGYRKINPAGRRSVGIWTSHLGLWWRELARYHRFGDASQTRCARVQDHADQD